MSVYKGGHMRREQHTFSAVLRDDLELHGVGLGLFSLLRFFVSHDEWFWWWASLERQGRGGLCSEEGSGVTIRAASRAGARSAPKL